MIIIEITALIAKIINIGSSLRYKMIKTLTISRYNY